MKLFFFKDIFDNVVTDEASIDFDWSELVEVFAHHKIADTKEAVELFIAADFDTNPRTSRLATQVKNDADGNMLSETIKLGIDGTPASGRYSDNVLAVNAIVLDYDGGATMEDVIAHLDGITHLGYTSYSHLKDGTTEKFRVIIPLQSQCPKQEWDLRKDDVLNLFPGTDASTINISRAFYIPSCPSKLKFHAFAWNVDGDLFDWNVLNRKEPLPEPTPIDRTNLVSTGFGKVIWETFDMVQFMKDEGLYQKHVAAHKHNVTCPNYMNHTGSAQGGTTMWQDGSGFPSFYCSHAHCSDFSFWGHFKEQYGPGWMKNYCYREEEQQLPKVAQLILKRRTKG